MDSGRKLKDDGGHFLRKQSKVSSVTVDSGSPTHVLMQGESAELQGHLEIEHVNM